MLQDCRHSKCHRCGVMNQERELCAHMLRSSIEGRKKKLLSVLQILPLRSSFSWGASQKEFDEKPSVQRLIFRIGIMGESRFGALGES